MRRRQPDQTGILAEEPFPRGARLGEILASELWPDAFVTTPAKVLKKAQKLVVFVKKVVDKHMNGHYNSAVHDWRDYFAAGRFAGYAFAG